MVRRRPEILPLYWRTFGRATSRLNTRARTIPTPSRARPRPKLRADLAVVLAFPGGHECGLIERGRALPGASVPIPGFGSSDCRSCAAHLLAVPPDNGFAALIAGLGDQAPLWQGPLAPGLPQA